MHLEFRYTFKDYREAISNRSRFTRIWSIVWMVVLPFFVAGIIITAFDSRGSNSSGSVITYIPILGFFLLMSPFGTSLLSYLRWKQQPALHGALIYDVDEGGIVVTTETSKSEMKWETFTRFAESKNLFMLFAGKYLFYLIPKRAFDSEANLAEFRELAKRRTGRERGRRSL